jgi:hypothetical protein
MSNLVPINANHYVDTRGSRAVPLSRSASRALNQVEERNLLRIAKVQSEGMVQAEKIREISHLGRIAATDYALLYKYSNTVATADPLLHDDLRLICDTARFGMVEVIGDTIDTYCREGRS